MTSFETNLEAIQLKANFELDLLQEYMKYWIECKWNVCIIERKDIIKEPFEVGCNRYLANQGIAGIQISGINSNTSDWETEVIVSEKTLIEIKPISFNQMKQQIYSFQVNINQFKRIIKETIDKIKFKRIWNGMS